MNARRIAEIRERLDKATPGPWFWSGQKNSRVGPELSTMLPGQGRSLVMDCVRLGMRAAQPRFNVDGGMVNGNDLAEREVHYRDDIASVAHPDADLIAHAPEDLAFLLDLVAPVPSGEVETPCATCGERGHAMEAPRRSILHSDDPADYPCPDCGVETPEAAVEAVAQAVARERCGGQVYMDSRHQVNAKDRRQAREYVTVAQYAFVAQGWAPPGGTK